MGYIRHHAIVVSAAIPADLKAAHKKAKELFKDITPVSSIQRSFVNGYQSFMVAPDGSKEGWENSSRGNEARDKFVLYLGTERGLDWIEVQFGDDEDDNKALRHNASLVM